jgi:hypothetical protein
VSVWNKHFQFPLIKDKAGGYFYALECSDLNYMMENRRKLGSSLFMAPEYSDYKVSYDKARSNDPYFFYLFKDKNNNWLAYTKKYAGDKIELVGFLYVTNFAVREYGAIDVSYKMRYDRIYTVDEEIKSEIDIRLLEWGIRM